MIDPKIPNNSIVFAAIPMTDADRIAGSIFTPLQKQVIKSELVTLAQELVDLVPPPIEGGYIAHVREHARLTGASKHLLHLLDKSDAAEEEYVIPDPEPLHAPNH